MEKDERNMYVFIWKIENYSYSWLEVNGHFPSPSFQILATEGSLWHLNLYPRGKTSSKNFTGIYLERESNTQGAMYLSVDYELSFLKSDGTPGYIAAEKACVFRKGQICGFANLVSREEILMTKRAIFLPDDTLTVRCRICLESIGFSEQIQALARSKVWISRQIFIWDSGDFNYISPRKQGCFAKLSFPKDEVLWLNLDKDAVLVRIEIKNVDDRVLRFRIGILDSSKSTSNFRIDEYVYNPEKRSIQTFLTSRSNLLQRKELYLPRDRLKLYCEVSYSKGFQLGHIECETYDKDRIFTFYTFDKENNSKASPPSIAHSFCCENSYNSMKNDFHALYQEGTLCDFTIKVGSENLLVHKAVLCARSSVFKAMLTSNMKEKETNMVDISDLEINTVRRMLTFMYTDTADDLDWETANKLYSAADKYDITMLKRICSDFLKINLMAANVKGILALAETHADEDLKKVASKFLFEYYRQITMNEVAH